MRLAFAKPAPGERYLTTRKIARDVARKEWPELPLLGFQTRHGPNMSEGVAYCARFLRWQVLILSVDDRLITPELEETFAAEGLPSIKRRAAWFAESGCDWSCELVAHAGALVEVTSSAGITFPSSNEIAEKLRKSPSNVIAKLRRHPAASG
jgi:hypothetical protein